MPTEIADASTEADLDEVRTLLGEYAAFTASLWPAVDHAAFAEEQRTLRDLYPLILLARVDGSAAGCVMLRAVDGEPETCEVRRLFVRPEFRRAGVARALLARLTAEAKARGFRRVTLVTVRLFPGAIPLYESLGFEHMEPWRATAMPREIIEFMARDLQE